MNADIVYNLESKAKYDRFESFVKPLDQKGDLKKQTDKPTLVDSMLPRPNTIEHLKYWWDKASLHEQDDFRLWINEN